jgi:hypothetical protein
MVLMRRGVAHKARALGKPLIAMVAVAAVAAAAAYTTPGFRDQAVLTSSQGGTFAIRGHIVGLYPGRQARLRLTVTNRNPFAIRVTSIRVKVSGVPGCAAANVRVTSFQGSLRVSPMRTRRLRRPITMSASAPDACMGARFKLTYTGRAVKG